MVPIRLHGRGCFGSLLFRLLFCQPAFRINGGFGQSLVVFEVSPRFLNLLGQNFKRLQAKILPNNMSFGRVGWVSQPAEAGGGGGRFGEHLWDQMTPKSPGYY